MARVDDQRVFALPNAVNATELDERELLAHYRPWLRKVASGMTSNPDRWEDLAQEGWIAMWKAQQVYDGQTPLDWWLKFKANKRMLHIVMIKWRTAKELQHISAGHPRSLRGTEGSHGWDYYADAIWDQLRVELPEVELAYHHGQISAALDRLTPREREYVRLRFWGGLNFPELTAHFGYEPQGLWRRARTKLRAELEHLEGLVDHVAR